MPVLTYGFKDFKHIAYPVILIDVCAIRAPDELLAGWTSLRLHADGLVALTTSQGRRRPVHIMKLNKLSFIGDTGSNRNLTDHLRHKNPKHNLTIFIKVVCSNNGLVAC